MSRIQIPSFDDFIDSVGPERIEQWTEEANEAIAALNPIYPPLNQKTMNDFVTALSCMNQSMTMAMMRDYHEWLIGELSRKSLHLL